MTETVLYRRTLWAGTALYAVLLLWALWHYRERMLFSDMAFQTFQILRNGSVQVQSGRFGAAGTQVFAWAAQYFHWPLKGVLLSYSAGHVLFQAAAFAWVAGVLRQWRWAWVLMLQSVLMTAHTFYWLSEPPQGLAFLIALLAWVDTRTTGARLSIAHWLLWGAASVTVVYFHPLMIYVLVYAAVFRWLTQEEASRRRLWWVAVGLAAVVWWVKYKILPLDWYDAMSMSRAEAFRELWPHWWNIQSNRDFIHWTLTDYYLWPVFWAGAVGLLWRRGFRWAAAWAAVFPLAYILLINVPFHAGDQQFYLENMYLPLALMVGLPVVMMLFEAPTGSRRTRWAWWALVLVLGARTGHIVWRQAAWGARLEWVETLAMRPDNPPKMLIKEEKLPKDLLKFTWGIPYETALLTALEGPQAVRLVFPAHAISDSLAGQKRLFLGSFKHYPFDQLPAFYLQPDTRTGYVWYPEN